MAWEKRKELGKWGKVEGRERDSEETWREEAFPGNPEMAQG